MDQLKYNQHLDNIDRSLTGIPAIIQSEIIYAAQRGATRCSITQIESIRTISDVARSIFSVIEEGDYLAGKVTKKKDPKTGQEIICPYVPKNNITRKGKTLTIKGQGLLQNIAKYLKKEF